MACYMNNKNHTEEINFLPMKENYPNTTIKYIVQHIGEQKEIMDFIVYLFYILYDRLFTQLMYINRRCHFTVKLRKL